jgi:hypothetical protein
MEQIQPETDGDCGEAMRLIATVNGLYGCQQYFIIYFYAILRKKLRYFPFAIHFYNFYIVIPSTSFSAKK